MNYRELIKNWHAKASEEDYFSKFVFEYLAFIAPLRIQQYPISRNDRQAIQRLKQDNEVKRKYLTRISTRKSLKNDWEQIKAELQRARLGNASVSLQSADEIKWWNCPHEDFSLLSNEEREKTKGVLHSDDDWQNMVEFWHSIRNNLFHGAKDPDSERDQIMVKHGYRTLKELMSILIYENEQI
jgi:hypothetical protein